MYTYTHTEHFGKAGGGVPDFGRTFLGLN